MLLGCFESIFMLSGYFTVIFAADKYLCQKLPQRWEPSTMFASPHVTRLNKTLFRFVDLARTSVMVFLGAVSGLDLVEGNRIALAGGRLSVCVCVLQSASRRRDNCWGTALTANYERPPPTTPPSTWTPPSTPRAPRRRTLHSSTGYTSTSTGSPPGGKVAETLSRLHTP